MATQFEIDCALMAGLSYQSTRDKINWFPAPSGWREFSHVPNSTYSTTQSFEASAFQNTATGEIVISYAGTSQLTAADAMLDRFTRDLWRVAQDGGLTLTDKNINKTLMAFAMQMYYENANATDINKELFHEVSGGIRFNREDVAANLSDAKGYASYFLAYLQENFTGSELASIIPSLPNTKDWYIQAGGVSMAATGGAERAFMLGGNGDDQLTGGSEADLLLGNDSNIQSVPVSTLRQIRFGTGADDTLTGGDKIDHLYGGSGNDVIAGGAANDALEGQLDSDELQGGAANDAEWMVAA
ncbi:MAG: hypothetical protein ACYC2R_16215 [Burkholderiales bacterium]